MFKKNNYILVLILILAYGVALVGCDDTEEHEESQDEHVCEHLTGGPVVVIQASENEQQALSTLASNDSYRIQAVLHTRFDVELLQDTTLLYYGSIPYTPIGESGDYILYMDKQAEVQLINTGDSTVIIPEELIDYSDDCEAVKFRAIYELNADDIYMLTFQDNIDSVVGTIFVPAEDGHDH